MHRRPSPGRADQWLRDTLSEPGSASYSLIVVSTPLVLPDTGLCVQVRDKQTVPGKAGRLPLPDSPARTQATCPSLLAGTAFGPQLSRVAWVTVSGTEAGAAAAHPQPCRCKPAASMKVCEALCRGTEPPRGTAARSAWELRAGKGSRSQVPSARRQRGRSHKVTCPAPQEAHLCVTDSRSPPPLAGDTASRVNAEKSEFPLAGTVVSKRDNPHPTLVSSPVSTVEPCSPGRDQD